MRIRSFAAALVALTVLPLGLAACGDPMETPTLSTSADGDVVAELGPEAGDAWTVTLPAGATEAYDLYGNDGGDPIAIWAEGAGPVSADVDQLFAIGLRQQGGTGFAWRPLEDTASGAIVELVQQGVNPHDPGEGVPGGEETHYYVYRATAAGTGRIEFGLYGPGADEPERTAAFDITVS